MQACTGLPRLETLDASFCTNLQNPFHFRTIFTSCQTVRCDDNALTIVEGKSSRVKLLKIILEK